jgi:hypothetical protein
MENWSGDKGPPFSVQTTSLKPGTHDRAAMTWGTYGSRNGRQSRDPISTCIQPPSARAPWNAHWRQKWTAFGSR